MPEKETKEIEEIFSEMGFTEAEQQTAVKRITADKEIWLKFMVQEEIGISPGMIDNPYEIGLVSAGSFLVGALPAILLALREGPEVGPRPPSLSVSARSPEAFLRSASRIAGRAQRSAARTDTARVNNMTSASMCMLRIPATKRSTSVGTRDFVTSRFQAAW